MAERMAMDSEATGFESPLTLDPMRRANKPTRINGWVVAINYHEHCIESLESFQKEKECLQDHIKILTGCIPAFE